MKVKNAVLISFIFLCTAELLFASSTIFIKILSVVYNFPSLEISFSRFFLGFIILYAYKNIAKQQIIVVNKNAVYLRGVLNTIAVIFYYLAFKYTTLTKANILNMTYPIFVAFFSPFLLKEKPTLPKILSLVISFMGIYLVINPTFYDLNNGDLIALASGITGSLAVITLRKARLTDGVFTVMYYLMLIGTVILVFTFPVFIIPDSKELILLVTCSLFGVAGQLFLTVGYKFLPASEASIFSNTRIIFASFLGTYFFGDLLTIRIIIGAVFIIISTIIINLTSATEK